MEPAFKGRGIPVGISTSRRREYLHVLFAVLPFERFTSSLPFIYVSGVINFYFFLGLLSNNIVLYFVAQIVAALAIGTLSVGFWVLLTCLHLFLYGFAF